MSSLALLRLVRWPGAATAAANAAAAFLLAHRPDSAGGWRAAAGACAGGFLVYAGGVALNDVADAERDRTIHPARPLPSGAVTLRAATWFGVALLAAGIVLSASLANVDAGIATAAAALFAVIYDFGARRSRVAASLCLGLARGANAAAGALAAAGSASLLFDAPDLAMRAQVFVAAIAAYATVLTYISTFEDRTLPRWAPGLFAVLLTVTAAAAVPLFLHTRWSESPALPLVLLLGTLVMGARAAMEEE